MSSLPVRETILGVLKSRDPENIGRIHSSDFRMAISDLGFTMTSDPVADILVHCRIDPNDGCIDFTQLERELSTERRTFNSKTYTKNKFTTYFHGQVSKSVASRC
jgi:Ca2+-binding EF-hand superfamily protein